MYGVDFNGFFVFNLMVINVVNAGVFLWLALTTDGEKRRKMLLLGAINVPVLLVLSCLMAWALGIW